MSVAVLHSNSAEGRSALASAVRETHVRTTDLVVLHAFSGSPDPESGARETAAVTSALQTSLAEIDGADSITWRVETGAPDPDATTTLLAMIEDTKAEIVVIGSRHRSAVGKFLMGQSIQRLLLEIRTPVLLVKSE